MPEAPVLALEALGHGFVQGGSRLTVLEQASLAVAAGESVGLVAPSGAGKSTLLHIAGLLERPEQGRVRILGTASDSLGEGGRTRMRRAHIGFVYQFHHLLPEFSARENLVVPQLIAGRPRSAARARADALLAAVELGHRADHRPARLSGGEQQRVAIARALANQPDLVLADEPTGNLDPATSERVFATLLGQVREHGVGALIATHSAELAARLDRRVALRGGRIEAE